MGAYTLIGVLKNTTQNNNNHLSKYFMDDVDILTISVENFSDDVILVGGMVLFITCNATCGILLRVIT